MELIVNISEEDYNECKFRRELLSLGGEPTDLTFNMRMETIIAKATPLEEKLKEIKEEIQGLIDFEESCCGDTTLGYECLDVIEQCIEELKGENNG